jgi:hypothetical protein
MAERASALGMGQGPVELRGRPAPLPRRTDAVASEEPISSGVDGRQLAGWLAPDREVYGTGSGATRKTTVTHVGKRPRQATGSHFAGVAFNLLKNSPNSYASGQSRFLRMPLDRHTSQSNPAAAAAARTYSPAAYPGARPRPWLSPIPLAFYSPSAPAQIQRLPLERPDG